MQNTTLPKMQMEFYWKESSTASWTANAVTANCTHIDCKVDPNLEEKKDSDRVGNRICQVSTPRILIDVQIAPNYFDPAINTSCTADWLYLQKFLCAKQRKIVYNNSLSGSPSSLQGISLFNNKDNVWYVNIKDYKVDPIRYFANTDFIGEFQIVMYTIDKVNIQTDI